MASSSDERMFNVGVLVITRPLQSLTSKIPQLLEKSAQRVRKTLYVHLQPCNSESAKNGGNVQPQLKTLSSNPQLRNTVFEFYQAGSKKCNNTDVRVLISHLTSISKTSESLVTSSPYCYSFKHPCDVVLIDHILNPSEKVKFLQDFSKLLPLRSDADVETIGSYDEDCGQSMKDVSVNGVDANLEVYQHAVMGGTFDRLHPGHKILLTDACLRCSESVTVGVTDGPMNKNKILYELMLPIDQRIAELRNFMEEIKPRLEYKLVPITDMFGPSTVDPLLQSIVVSQETLRGGHKVNEERKKKGLSILDIHCIELIEDMYHSSEEEVKISSSSARKRLLGTLLKEVKPKSSIGCKPYRIGLTGGIASGKSSICKRLENLGAGIVDCDKLGHKVYIKGSPTFYRLTEVFGPGIIDDDGEINRKALGGIVFSDKSELQKLNEIVWPEIAKLAEEQIQVHADSGKSVVILDAAVLFEAGWDGMVHEAWSTIIPTNEAVKRIQDRNKLSETEALKRINSQMTSEDRVQRSNVILSTLWEYEVTQKQVEKAWTLLQDRLPKDKSQL